MNVRAESHLLGILQTRAPTAPHQGINRKSLPAPSSVCLLMSPPCRHFVKVLHSPAHLQYFRQFLEERGAAEPLRFWMAVEKLAAETNTKTKNLLVNSIVRNYFHGEIPAGRHPPIPYFTQAVTKASFP